MGRLLPAGYAVASLMFGTLCLPRAYADDTSKGVMLQGLRSVPAGSVTVSSASLVLRAGHIEVTLTLTARRGQGGSVAIQMPRFGWLGEAEPYPARQFPELEILVGGVPAKMESTFAASVGSVDVTEAIRAAGVDPFAIADTPPFVSPGTGGISAFETLEHIGAVEKYEGHYLAKWKAQRTVEVALKPGSANLTLKYKARPGYGLFRFGQLTSPDYLAKYCLSAQDLAGVFRQAAANRMFAVTEYSIPVSIDDRPAPSLSVAVDALGTDGAPRSLIAFCGPGGKSVVGQATSVESSARSDTKGIVRILSIGAVNGSQ